MEQAEQVSATRETATTKDDKDMVRLWLDALALADTEESTWRERAQETIDIYRNSKQRLGDVLGANDRRFNILHSNVETIMPAIYNSTPIPDVRRRFNDDDPAGKEVSDLLERALSFSVDSYDFDASMKHDIQDMELTGRGLARVRYVPYIGHENEATEGAEQPTEPQQPEAEAGLEGVHESGKELGESLDYEEVLCEHVPWKHFRHGPGRTWADVPWIAFELFLTREELTNLAPKIGGSINLDTTLSGADEKSSGENIKEVFKRSRVWEIWDKNSRKVLFIAPSYKDAPIKDVDDPLDLMAFFPIPRPLYAIETSDTLLPVIPYDIYRDQAEELERVSRRIMALVEGIKSRGIYDGSMKEIDQLSEADDNTLIAVENAVRYADGSGLEKGIAWWPMDSAIKALAQLVEHRERIKATIYEITGISDILRGQTDASETATAQNIKQQWGSLRIQNKQGNIQRYARDLFRLKAEIIANKFQWQTITLMTGLDYPTKADKMQAQQAAQMQQAQAQQAPQPGQPPAPAPELPPQIKAILEKPAREDVEALLRNDATRNFRVDVESDSTVRADMTRNQQNMTLFLQGTAQFAQAMGPIVMTFKEMTPAVLEVFSAFSRNFKLGKQAEDALDAVADKSREMAANPPPPQMDPQQQAEQAKAQAAMKQAELDLQAAQQKHQMDMERMQAELQIKKEELALKREELQMKAQAQQMDMQATQQKHAMDAQAQDRQAQFDERRMSMEMQRSEREHALGMESAETKHDFGMEAMAEKARAAKAKPAARA